MMFWSVGPFWYMVYGIWYVVYGMKMAYTVYSHMFCVCRAGAAYNVVHLFLVDINCGAEYYWRNAGFPLSYLTSRCYLGNILVGLYVIFTSIISEINLVSPRVLVLQAAHLLLLY